MTRVIIENISQVNMIYFHVGQSNVGSKTEAVSCVTHLLHTWREIPHYLLKRRLVEPQNLSGCFEEDKK